MNNFEKFFISFGIGLSIYISYSYVLDIIKLFNFFSAYLSIILIDIFFIAYLIYNREINREKIIKQFDKIKHYLSNNYKSFTIFIIILLIIFFIQFIMQWDIMTNKFPLLAKDPYSWLGDTWYLLEKGFLYRENLNAGYPNAYTFFTAGISLVNPDYYVSFFLFKFGGIPLLSFYILIFTLILKKLFKNKNYMIFLGLLLFLTSSYFTSRINYFISSSIPILLFLILLIILMSNCPLYLVGFFFPPLYLMNPLYGLLIFIALMFYLIVKYLSTERILRKIILKNLILSFIISLILMIPYLLHLYYTLDVSFLDLIIKRIKQVGVVVNQNAIFQQSNNLIVLMIFRSTIEQLFMGNVYIDEYLNIIDGTISTFFVFSLMSLIIPIKNVKNRNLKNILIMGKISIILIISFHLLYIYSSPESSNFIVRNSYWIKKRTLEVFSIPVIIMACYTIDYVIEKIKKLTNYLINHSKKYRRLILEKKSRFKIMKISNLFIIMVLISSFNIFLTQKRLPLTYYFQESQIKSIFFIKENINSNSTILLPELKGNENDYLYNLLNTYNIYLWNYLENNNSMIKNYISDKNIKFIMIDLKQTNSTDLNLLLNDVNFDKLYENQFYIIFEYKSID